MTHPEVTGEIQVFESAVPVHMASGWSPVEQPDPVEDANELDELRAVATELGIDVNSRWGAARLAKEIDAARSAGTTQEN